MKKRLLVYVHYFVPDTAATGQLHKELLDGMKEQFDITVICVVPSYLGKVDDYYKKQKYYWETIDGIRTLRIRVPEFDKADKKSRIKNIVAYFFGAMSATFKVGKQDYVYSISQPPILGGLLGVWGKWIKHAKYIYKILDYNPEQTMAVGYSKNKLVLKLMMALDKFSCRRADKVIVVGRDMVETLKHRFKGKKVPDCININDWIDEKKIYPLDENHERVLEFKKQYGLEEKFVVMYSGNIGLYYDLENLIKIVEKFPKGTKAKDGREVVFPFIGAGSIKEKLEEYVEKHHMENVMFIPYQKKEDLIYSLNAGDVHWVVNAKGIKGVSVPSKCYGVMGVGKPALAVLEENSEGRLLIEEAECGLCCEPGDYAGIEQEIRWFIDHAGTEELKDMGRKGREFLEGHLSKDEAIKRHIEEIEKI